MNKDVESMNEEEDIQISKGRYKRKQGTKKQKV